LFSFFFKKKKPVDVDFQSFLLKKVGYRPKNMELFSLAFTHKSYSNLLENEESNERLEYLGDRVIDLIVAEFLFEKFPKKEEGELTKIKSKIVNRKTLSMVGAEMNLIQYIRYAKNRSINIQTLEGNAFEALIGALYLDSGYDKTKSIFNDYIIRNYIDLNKIMEEEIDFKSTLLIWCQKNKLTIDFEVIEDATKENNFEYNVQIIINKKEWGIGKGKSKKEAEQNASRETLELLGL